MKEVLPDIILMPNAGTKAMMWQETAGVKRDTSARFMFPVFTAVDLEDMMIETMGRYRWEICRKIQGVHWNDIREKSLTAEYCDYMQFTVKFEFVTCMMQMKCNEKCIVPTQRILQGSFCKGLPELDQI